MKRMPAGRFGSGRPLTTTEMISIAIMKMRRHEADARWEDRMRTRMDVRDMGADHFSTGRNPRQNSRLLVWLLKFLLERLWHLRVEVHLAYLLVLVHPRLNRQQSFFRPLRELL